MLNVTSRLVRRRRNDRFRDLVRAYGLNPDQYAIARSHPCFPCCVESSTELPAAFRKVGLKNFTWKTPTAWRNKERAVDRQVHVCVAATHILSVAVATSTVRKKRSAMSSNSMFMYRDRLQRYEAEEGCGPGRLQPRDAYVGVQFAAMPRFMAIVNAVDRRCGAALCARVMADNALKAATLAFERALKSGRFK
jgi:hypothetical protein